MGPQQHEALAEQEQAFLEGEGDREGSIAESVFEVVPPELADLEEHQMGARRRVWPATTCTRPNADATMMRALPPLVPYELTTLNPPFIDPHPTTWPDTHATGPQAPVRTS